MRAPRRLAGLPLLAVCGLVAAQSALFDPKPVMPQGPPVPVGDERAAVSERALINGVSADRAACEALDQALWIETELGNACIRYYAAGFEPAVRAPGKLRAVAYFAGDMWDGWRAVNGYEQFTPEWLRESARTWAARLGQPYVLLARPGMLGSSGEHMQRRRPAESRLMSAALDALRPRLGVAEWVLAGYSGGGHVVASLLSLRADVVCGVAIAGVASPRLRMSLKRWSVDATGHADSFEPLERLRREALHPALRAIVVGDPQDSNAVWPAQTILAERLSALGVATAIVPVRGRGMERHGGQGDIGRDIAGWCARDLPFAEIAERARAATVAP